MLRRWLQCSWLVFVGCARSAALAPANDGLMEEGSANTSAKDAPLERETSAAVSEYTCEEGASAATPWLPPLLNYEPRQKPTDHQPGYVGMTWSVAQPTGLPAVSRDGRWVAFWVGEEAYASPAPIYHRAVVVEEVAVPGHRQTFNLLGHEELLRALPRGEAPEARSLRLSEWRLGALEERVKARVASTNEWLETIEWSPMSVCKPDAAVQAVRMEGFRVSLSRGAPPERLLVSVVDANGLRRVQQSAPGGTCEGEPWLVSVSLAPLARVVLVETATVSSDWCGEPNAIRLYRIDDSGEREGSTAIPSWGDVPASQCSAPARALPNAEPLLRSYRGAELSVYRVSPTDTLKLRALPGVRAPVVAEIPYLAQSIRPTGAACLSDGVAWLEAAYGKHRGWVSERHVALGSAFEDLDSLGQRPLADFTSTLLTDLTAKVRRAVDSNRNPNSAPNRNDVAVQTELVGERHSEGVAEVVLFEPKSMLEYVAFAVLADGLWTLEALERRALCRGERGLATRGCPLTELVRD